MLTTCPGLQSTAGRLMGNRKGSKQIFLLYVVDYDSRFIALTLLVVSAIGSASCLSVCLLGV